MPINERAYEIAMKEPLGRRQFLEVYLEAAMTEQPDELLEVIECLYRRSKLAFSEDAGNTDDFKAGLAWGLKEAISEINDYKTKRKAQNSVNYSVTDYQKFKAEFSAKYHVEPEGHQVSWGWNGYCFNRKPMRESGNAQAQGVDDEFLDDVRKTRAQVMLKYYCQHDGRLATPLANTCPELGRLLGMVGDLINKLKPLPKTDIEGQS